MSDTYILLKAQKDAIEAEQRSAIERELDALRTRCDELEAALRRAEPVLDGLIVKFHQNPMRPDVAILVGPADHALSLARHALRNPSPSPPAVVTRPDEPPAQARERIRQ